MTRRTLLASLAAIPALRGGDKWIPLFDGKSLKNWTPSENRGSWKVADGMLAADGGRSHLFYSGAVRNADFKNFELRVELLARPKCNSGVFFHSRFQESGWPEQGFEVQVNNTATGEGGYLERKKTASLYGVRNIYKQLVPDNEWFVMHIAVRGKQVQIRLNDMLVVDYIEPDPPLADPDSRGRILQHGTFALQCHDSGSKALFRKILVRPLPDDLRKAGEPPVVDDVYREIRNLSARNYPVVDYHSHLKGGLDIEQVLRHSRETGIGYGLAINCGLGFPTKDDAAALDYIRSLEGKPVFIAMQAEGREWVNMFSAATVAKFDYVFTDAMTFTHDGRRRRLWIPDEVGEIGDPERFMDVIVDKIAGILEREPVDIYANPTFLPDVMTKDYDKLWTAQRMARVIAAAKKNDVAIEINNRYKIPSPTFIKTAKAAGVKFSFGTNNGDANMGRLEYPLQMVRECRLQWQDIFVPKPDGEKPVQRRGMPSTT